MRHDLITVVEVGVMRTEPGKPNSVDCHILLPTLCPQQSSHWHGMRQDTVDRSNMCTHERVKHTVRNYIYDIDRNHRGFLKLPHWSEVLSGVSCQTDPPKNYSLSGPSVGSIFHNCFKGMNNEQQCLKWHWLITESRRYANKYFSALSQGSDKDDTRNRVMSLEEWSCYCDWSQET